MINFKLRSGVWLVSVLVSSCSPHLTQAAGQGCSAAGRRGGQLPPATLTTDGPLVSSFCSSMRHETCFYCHDQNSLLGVGRGRETQSQGEREYTLSPSRSTRCSLASPSPSSSYDDQNFIGSVSFSVPLFLHFPSALRQKVTMSEV